MSRVFLIVDDGSLVKHLKTQLSLSGKFDKSQKICKCEGEFIIPTLYESIDQLDQEIVDNSKIRHVIKEYESPMELSSNKFESIVKHYLEEVKITSNEADKLISKIPKKYTLYPPLLLINNQDTFESKEWTTHFQNHSSTQFYENLLSHFPQITHIALNKPIIEQDIMRRPFNIFPLFGDFGPEPTIQMFDNPTQEDFNQAFWCTAVQNGIYQTWAPRYTMFSRGNIKEKARLLKFKGVTGTTVIDMYAGIGYFTLSYLKLGARVFCFEINPWSIQGLIRGVEQNGFTYKVVGKDEVVEWDENVQCWIFNESNEFATERLRQTGKLKFNISHINMGLLPSSRQCWEHVLEIASTFSSVNTTIHMHENESVDNLPQFMESTASKLMNLPLLNGNINHGLQIQPLHLEKIKTFAPGVWHICADFLLAIPPS